MNFLFTVGHDGQFMHGELLPPSSTPEPMPMQQPDGTFRSLQGFNPGLAHHGGPEMTSEVWWQTSAMADTINAHEQIPHMRYQVRSWTKLGVFSLWSISKWIGTLYEIQLFEFTGHECHRLSRILSPSSRGFLIPLGMDILLQKQKIPVDKGCLWLLPLTDAVLCTCSSGLWAYIGIISECSWCFFFLIVDSHFSCVISEYLV